MSTNCLRGWFPPVVGRDATTFGNPSLTPHSWKVPTHLSPDDGVALAGRCEKRKNPRRVRVGKENGGTMPSCNGTRWQPLAVGANLDARVGGQKGNPSQDKSHSSAALATMRHGHATLLGQKKPRASDIILGQREPIEACHGLLLYMLPRLCIWPE